MVSMYKTQKMCRDDCLVVCFKNSSYVKGTTHTHTPTCSCSVGTEEEGGAGSDHPVRRSFPEGNYLQALAAGSMEITGAC